MGAFTFEEAQEYVSRYTYKPEHTLTLERGPLGLICVKLRAACPSVTDPTYTHVVTTTNLTNVPPLLRAVLDHAVLQTVARFEKHEQDEWLRLDGRVINNPHPEVPGYAERRYNHVHDRSASASLRGSAHRGRRRQVRVLERRDHQPVHGPRQLLRCPDAR